MAVSAEGRVVAADAATGTLFAFDPSTGTIAARRSLGAGADPGRIAIDGEGRAHVVLRRSGELLSVRVGDLAVLARRPVCGAPRGVAVDGGSLHVACAGGELVTLPAAGGAPTRTVWLEPDLRDVVVGDGVLHVSRFRSAELLTVDAAGRIVARRRPADRTAEGRLGPLLLEPNTAYRIRPAPGGGVTMLHQRAVRSPIDVETDGYAGGACRTGVVESALTTFPAGGGAPTSSGALGMVALAVDFVYSDGGERIHLASAALNDHHPGGGLLALSTSGLGEECVFAPPANEIPAVAVAALPEAGVVSLHHDSTTLFGVAVDGALSHTPHPGDPRRNRGFALFHMASPSGVACASCHPEGGEDGHVWDFVGTGPRRTQTLLGGLLETAPFHWNGDRADMDAIMADTFRDRMGAGFVPDDVAAIEAYLDAQPLPAGVAPDPEAVTRGRAVFEGAGGCVGCHAGEALTDHRTLDVGTGRAFQVPTLRGVLHRAPYFHDGCAPTLSDVLETGCGSPEHAVPALGEAARADLLAYLRSL
jgi:mono/diheme cytochrome c family protein